jgi:hypothetical protein
LLIGRERNCSFPHFLCATSRNANLTNVKRKKRKKQKRRKEIRKVRQSRKLKRLAALPTTPMDSEWIMYSRAGSHMSVK